MEASSCALHHGALCYYHHTHAHQQDYVTFWHTNTRLRIMHDPTPEAHSTPSKEDLLSKKKSRTYGVSQQKSDDLALPRHPDSPPDNEWRTWVHQLEVPLAVDLFCGAGGLSLGLEQAGCKVILAVDIDERALTTHRANFAGSALALDLSEPEQLESLISRLDGINVDILAGGPPCQPFSRAGRSKIRSLVANGSRPAKDERSELWRSFLQVVHRMLPRSVLFENVPDLALGDDSKIIRTMANSLEELGYAVDYNLVDAWKYGVPQHRQRLVLVAIRGETFRWPLPNNRVTVRDAIGDLPHLQGGIGARSLKYNGPATGFQSLARQQIPPKQSRLIYDHMTRPVRDDDRQAFQLMDSSTSYSDLPKELRRYRADIFNDKYNRLDWEKLSRTITAHIAKDGYWYIHPAEPRTITVREAARIQTFPDTFRFAGTRSHAFSQIGNAVPPALAAHVAKAILQSLPNEGQRNNTFPINGRIKARKALIDWHAKNQTPWTMTGHPWSVLISLLCGQRGARDGMASSIIRSWPTPRRNLRSTLPQVMEALGNNPKHNATLERIAWIGKGIAEHGWDNNIWRPLANLKPHQEEWLNTIGFLKKDLVATTAALRVATRYDLLPASATRATQRLAIARLVGSSDQATRVTAALTAIGENICRLSDPLCNECPLRSDCQSASLLHTQG